MRTVLEGHLGAEAGWGGAGQGRAFSDSQDTPFSFPQEPEVQAAQVSDMPVTSQQPEQVSGAVGGGSGPSPVSWA